MASLLKKTGALSSQKRYFYSRPRCFWWRFFRKWPCTKMSGNTLDTTAQRCVLLAAVGECEPRRTRRLSACWRTSSRGAKRVLGHSVERYHNGWPLVGAAQKNRCERMHENRETS